MPLVPPPLTPLMPPLASGWRQPMPQVPRSLPELLALPPPRPLPVLPTAPLQPTLAPTARSPLIPAPRTHPCPKRPRSRARPRRDPCPHLDPGLHLHRSGGGSDFRTPSGRQRDHEERPERPEPNHPSESSNHSDPSPSLELTAGRLRRRVRSRMQGPTSPPRPSAPQRPPQPSVPRTAQPSSALGRAATVIEPPTARQAGQRRPSPDRPPPRNRPVPNRRGRPDLHAAPTATNRSNQRWSRQIPNEPAISSRGSWTPWTSTVTSPPGSTRSAATSTSKAPSWMCSSAPTARRSMPSRS